MKENKGMEKDPGKILTEYQLLAEKLPPEAVEKTTKEKTKKAYDTTGYGYQYCVDRFNEVYGVDQWGYSYHIVKEVSGSYKSGQPYTEITIEMAIWVKTIRNERKCIGGHTSSCYADAYKGAITNGFKKTASFFGVGRDAYAGSIDDDLQPMPGKEEEKIPAKVPAPVQKGSPERDPVDMAKDLFQGKDAVPTLAEIEAQKLKLISVIYAILASNKINNVNARLWIHAKYNVASVKALSVHQLKQMIDRFKKMEQMSDPNDRTMAELKDEIEDFVKEMKEKDPLNAPAPVPAPTKETKTDDKKTEPKK